MQIMSDTMRGALLDIREIYVSKGIDFELDWGAVIYIESRTLSGFQFYFRTEGSTSCYWNVEGLTKKSSPDLQNLILDSFSRQMDYDASQPDYVAARVVETNLRLISEEFFEIQQEILNAGDRGVEAVYELIDLGLMAREKKTYNDRIRHLWALKEETKNELIEDSINSKMAAANREIEEANSTVEAASRALFEANEKLKSELDIQVANSSKSIRGWKVSSYIYLASVVMPLIALGLIAYLEDYLPNMLGTQEPTIIGSIIIAISIVVAATIAPRFQFLLQDSQIIGNAEEVLNHSDAGLTNARDEMKATNALFEELERKEAGAEMNTLDR